MNLKNILLFVYSALLLESCSEAFDFDEAKKVVLKGKEKEYAMAFENMFGTPNEACTWKMVNEASLKILMHGDSTNIQNVRLFTADPRIYSDKCFLLAEYIVADKSQQFQFDYPIGLSNVFVYATSAEGQAYIGRVDTEDTDTTYNVLLYADDEPIVSEIKKMHYTLLFEAFADGTLDFDYNDVVLDLEYARGEESMNVTLRAVGNSYNTRIAYQREKQDEDIFTEAHKALGYPVMYNYATEENIYYILNTGVNNSGRKATATVTLGSDKDKSICEVAANIIAYIMENDKKEDVVVKYALSSTPGQPNPEALLLSIPEWNYSREEMPIHVMYYDFLYWIKDPESNPYWSGDYWKN